MDLFLTIATLIFFLCGVGYVVFCDRLIDHDQDNGATSGSIDG